jgi:hypothetical protein
MSTTETTTALQARQPLNIDMRQGVSISNYSEAMQMASLVHHSGLAPKSLDTVQKVAVAMLMAVEVGLPVITGLQNIAVINGKAGVWGDAVLSLVRASGQMELGYPKEKETGTPFTDSWTFHCTVKRKGGPEVTGSFSWAEAKRAGFDNPQLRGGGKDTYSPWTRFPRRMMQWKARQWIYRDEFGDILRGMRMAEELHDIVDLEPSTTGQYVAPEVQPPTEPQGDRPEFNSLLPPDVDKTMVERYVATCAGHFKQSEQEFKAAIVQNGQAEDFLKAYRQWAAKQPTQPPPHGENAPQRGQELSEAPEGKESPDPWQEFRQEFINLRNAGFSTWIFKNRDRLAQAPDAIRQEAREKWGKLYPANCWPLDVEGAPEPQPALFESGQTPAVDFQTGEITEMVCPERDGKTVPVENCDGCEMRDSCPSWRNDDE